MKSATETAGQGTAASEDSFILYDAVDEMFDAESEQTIVEITVEAATESLGYSQVGVHEYDATEETLPPVEWSGDLEEELGHTANARRRQPRIRRVPA